MPHKTKWDLGHFYKGDIKKLVAKDLATTKREYLAFAKKYKKDKGHLKSPRALALALNQYEKISSNPASERPGRYYTYRKSLDSEDHEARAELAKLSDFYTNLVNEVQFFLLEIGVIKKDLQKKFLQSKELAPFRYLLKKIFENAKHQLTEPEEKIMNLKGLPAHGMWVSGFSKLIAKQTVKFGGKEIPVSEAQGKMSSLPTPKRRALHKDIMNIFKNIADFAESEINAIVTNKKINDRLRKFKTPYESTVKDYENEEKTVKDLAEAVSLNFPIAHKFFKIKAEMLGEKRLTYADRSAKVGETKVKIPIEEAIKKTCEAFNVADPSFGQFVEEMFARGLVDVFPKKGKGSGAFCSSGVRELPTYIFLNHTDDFRSLTTLAHEMGHALHSKYAHTQRPFYEDYTTATAEVASTFFENLVFEKALEGISEQEKIILLHDKINDDISTIFRQIACFNFEVELHESIRKEGFLTKEKIAQLMNKHMQSYLGPVFDLEELDGYFFATWSHIRNFFYVYSYAFGQLISDALYARYKQDKSKIKDVVTFLSAGGSDSPENIFRKIGINPNKKLFETGLLRIKANIDELEKLWQNNRK